MKNLLTFAITFITTFCIFMGAAPYVQETPPPLALCLPTGSGSGSYVNVEYTSSQVVWDFVSKLCCSTTSNPPSDQYCYFCVHDTVTEINTNLELTDPNRSRLQTESFIRSVQCKKKVGSQNQCEFYSNGGSFNPLSTDNGVYIYFSRHIYYMGYNPGPTCDPNDPSFTGTYMTSIEYDCYWENGEIIEDN